MMEEYLIPEQILTQSDTTGLILTKLIYFSGVIDNETYYNWPQDGVPDILGNSQFRVLIFS